MLTPAKWRPLVLLERPRAIPQESSPPGTTREKLLSCLECLRLTSWLPEAEISTRHLAYRNGLMVFTVLYTCRYMHVRVRGRCWILQPDFLIELGVCALCGSFECRNPRSLAVLLKDRSYHVIRYHLDDTYHRARFPSGFYWIHPKHIGYYPKGEYYLDE